MLEEFKKFALRGNVVDLAVGVIIGAAFGAIVVAGSGRDHADHRRGDGRPDFSNYYIPLSSKVQSGMPYAEAKKVGAVIGYGQFLTLAVNFTIIAFVLFMVIRAMNALKSGKRPSRSPRPRCRKM
jgi:large conductance mechanosensitive channel